MDEKRGHEVMRGVGAESEATRNKAAGREAARAAALGRESSQSTAPECEGAQSAEPGLEVEQQATVREVGQQAPSGRVTHEADDEAQLEHVMRIDDAYVVERRLSYGVDGVTELVTLDGAGPYVRKRMPQGTAHRMVWSALASCDCPYLPRVHVTYDFPDEFVVIYSYIPGETLEQVREHRGHLSLAEVTAIVANLGEAVAALHAHGVVHADIAPANVVLAADGAHLIDFGIARMVHEPPQHDEKAWGTRGFAAPEQHGFAAIDTRSDIYALGRLSGYVLTGAQLSEKTYEAELRCSNMVPEAVCRVLGRACAFEPSKRYQTVEDFVEAFATAADEGSVALADTSQKNDSVARTQTDLPAECSQQKRSASGGKGFFAVRRHKAIAIAVVALLAVGIAGIGLAINRNAGSSSANAAQQTTDVSSYASTDTDQADADTAANAHGTAVDSADTSDNGGATDSLSDQTSTTALVDQAVKDLVISDSSWYVSSSGFVYYAVAIQNTGSEVLALFPTLAITGRDADGSVVFTDEQVLNELYPGETRYWGGLAGDGETQPDTVEITLSRPSDYQVEAAHGEPTRLTVSDVSTSFDMFGNLQVTGEVTLDTLGDELAPSEIQLVAIGHDAQGDIVFGFDGYASLPAEGDAVAFELISDDNDLPDYASVEVYAYPW